MDAASLPSVVCPTNEKKSQTSRPIVFYKTPFWRFPEWRRRRWLNTCELSEDRSKPIQDESKQFSFSLFFFSLLTPFKDAKCQLKNKQTLPGEFDILKKLIFHTGPRRNISFGVWYFGVVKYLPLSTLNPRYFAAFCYLKSVPVFYVPLYPRLFYAIILSAYRFMISDNFPMTIPDPIGTTS